MEGEPRFGQGTLCRLRRVKSDVQHTLPENSKHIRLSEVVAKQIYATKGDPEGKSQLVNDYPARQWGEVTRTRVGGEQMIDSHPNYWEHGDFWNRDSLIRKWQPHHVRRQAAQSSHDIHRHDQITTLKLLGSNNVARVSTSGLLSADSSFLDAWGFPLGLRDRQSRPTSLWRPVSKIEQFRSKDNYVNSLENYHSNDRSKAERYKLCRSKSEGPDGDKTIGEGLQFGSLSYEGWNAWNHVCKREFSKMACSIFGQARVAHPWGIPHDQMDLRPGAIYTKKYKNGGDSALRDFVSRSVALDQGKINSENVSTKSNS
eukprot:GEMP01025462.1.p1 GENE.GEMP01025462.1~~GEMP01025462.1.p1  ORF type:complete len:315 (+),score=51.14 GEMP01025462.1:51-995(+)